MDSVSEGLDTDGLAALDSRVRLDLSALCYPPKNWVPETTRPNGDAVSDVVIIGGGMGGSCRLSDKFRHFLSTSP